MTEAEDLLPDYTLVPEWVSSRSASILFSHRGCIRACSFCAVPALEGKPKQVRPTTRVKHLIADGHKRVILWDNNILGESHWREVIDELRTLDLEVDFNQGLDARLVTEDVAATLRGVNIPTIRLAYDFVNMGDAVYRAVRFLKKAGLTDRRLRHICCYVLYNYKDSPIDLYRRVRDLLEWGVSAYPMRYQPLKGEHAFEKDSYVSPGWTPEQLDMVAAARRVIGYGGAFPPYEGLVNKFKEAARADDPFDRAFKLRAHPEGKAPRTDFGRKNEALGAGFELREFAWDLIQMGKDHQCPVPVPDTGVDARGMPREAVTGGKPATAPAPPANAPRRH